MNKKIINTISIIGVALLMLLSAVLIAVLYPKETRQLDLSLQTRTISVEQNVIDYESIFNEYDDAKLERDGSLTTFEGKQTIKLSDLEELDEVALSTLDDEELTLKYNYSYDYETDLVTLTVVQVETTGDGELIETIVDTIEGTAFVNEAGEIDAVLDLDGETILLSELQETGKLNNCGWFKRLFKKVSKAIKKVTKTVVGVIGAIATVAVPVVIGAVCAATGVGLIATVAAGAVAGAAIAASTAAASTYQQDGKVDWETVGICAGTGGVVGAVASGVAYGVTKVAMKIAGANASGPSKNVKSYSTYKSFKQDYGKASDYIHDGEWHHIVEQQTINNGSNAASNIYSSKNTVAISKNLHQKISGYYSSFNSKYNMVFRKYINTLSYEQQYTQGLEILKMFAKQLGEKIIWL